MSGEQEPWVFRGGLTADLQVGCSFILYFINTKKKWSVQPINNIPN